MKKSRSREKIVVSTSVINIILNVALAGFKAVVGIMSNSIAIVSDAVNNLSDVLSGVTTIVGMKFAGKAADEKHPYGHGRAEYVASLIVSSIVFYAGVAAAIESVRKIFHPEEVKYDTATIIVLVAAILTKICLGIYVKKTGKKVNSGSLVATGTDALNDAFLSTSVLVSVVIYLVFRVNIEAYVGVVVAAYIIKSGIGLIIRSVNDVIGVRAESAFAKKIKREIEKEEKVLGVFDLVLNDYGPDKYLGSVHIELPGKMTVAEVDEISKRISENVEKKYGVILHTVGVYAASAKDAEGAAVREEIFKLD